MEQPRDTHVAPPTAIRAARLTPSIEEARLTLAQLLAGQPPPGQVLAAAAALATLDDADDVAPPLPADVDPLPWDEGREQALTQLRAAIDEATSIENLTRIATAAIELRSAPEGSTEVR